MVAALLLGPAQRVVGVLDQGIGVVAVVREQRDADAGACGQLVAVHLRRRPQHVQQLLRDPRRGLGTGRAQEQHHELVAAQPCDRVALAQLLDEPVGDTLDDLVPGDQPQRIVDQLEPVEIDQHHRQQLAGATRPLDRLGQAVVEQQAVGQPGQRIVVGEAAQRLLRLPPPRQVAQHQHDHPPITLLDDAALDLHGQEFAGAAAERELQRHAARPRALQTIQEAAAMFRRQRQEQIDRRADRRVARVVEDGLRRAGQPIDGPLQIEQHDTVGDAVHHRVQPALAVARLGLAAVVHSLRLDQQRIHAAPGPGPGRRYAARARARRRAPCNRSSGAPPPPAPPASAPEPRGSCRAAAAPADRQSAVRAARPGSRRPALESRIHLQHAQVGADQGQRLPQRVQHALAERRSWRLQAFLPRAVPCHYLDQVVAERLRAAPRG